MGVDATQGPDSEISGHWEADASRVVPEDVATGGHRCL